MEFDKKAEINKIEKLEAVIKVKKVDEKILLIQSQQDIRPLLFKFAVENELKVLSMQLKEKSLEEVFRELTKKD